MLGAIIGDIVGSRFEFNPTNDYNFEFWTEECDFTDDTICTVAIADALLNRSDNFGKYLHEWCRRYPNPMGAYGGSFKKWIESDNPQPYNSFGNGSAMRVSPVAWAHKNLFGALPIAARTAECTHNHPEGIKGAQTVTVAIHKAIELKEIYGTIGEQQMNELLKVCVDFSGYNINIKKEDVINKFDVTCQGTVPVALWIIGQSNGFEDAVRKAVSLGADADTLGAIVGSIAEAIWGIPDRMVLDFVRKLPNDMMSVVLRFYKRFVKESILHGYGDEGAAKDLMLEEEKKDESEEAKSIMHWKLGLGHMGKFFKGENPLPDKSKVARASSWKIKKMPEKDISTLRVNIGIMAKDMEIIKRGHIPEAQEDHWFMYCTSDHIRYYRSWTGDCSFEAHYKKAGDNFIIDKLRMNHSLAEFGVNGDMAGLALFRYLLTAETGGNAGLEWERYFETWKELNRKYQDDIFEDTREPEMLNDSVKEAKRLYDYKTENRLKRLDRRDGTFARELVKDFIDEKLGGDIEGLMDYDFGEILGDEKYGMYKGASCQIEKCDIVKAIMSLVLEDTWPILNMDSLDDYTYNCGYVNSMQYLFGSNIGDKYFMSMRNFNPSEELVKQAVEVSHLQKHIGNFWVMPGHIDSNKETYHYHGLTDLWLKALSAVLADEKKVDYDLKGVVYNARQQMDIYQCANGFRMLAKNMMLDSYLDENGNPKDVLPHVWANMKGLKREEYLDAVEKYIVFMKSFILKRDEMMVKKLEKVLAQDNETQKNYVKNMLKKEKDNEYSKVGYKFVKAIKKIVSDKDTEDKRELFETLDRMRLEKGYKLGLKLALDAPLDMESWFFTYKTKPNVIDDGRTEIVPEGIDDCRWIFSHIKVERSTMGAWQAYLYNLAPTIMPTFDHGNYIKRKLIFGHKDLKGIKSLPFDGDSPLYGIKDELMPKVRIRGDEARIEACYWSEFYGLTKEKVVVKFAGEMIVDIKLVKEEVLIAYNCGILY